MFTPILNFNGAAIISYVVNDNLGATSLPASITVTVNPVNDPPVAVADNAVTSEDTPVVFNVTSNDTDPEGGINTSTVDLNLAIAGIQNSFTNAQGSWSVNGLGDVTFTPALNFNGVTIRSYTVNDIQGATSSAAEITITVNPVNDSPVANDDSGSTFIDTAITLFGITSNDTDIDGTVNEATVDLDILTIGIQNSFITAEGNWSVNGLGDVTFMPALSYSGTAVISYVVNDDLGASSSIATISILVSGINPMTIPPVAVDDGNTTNEDTPITFNITANDTDADGINSATVDLDLLTVGLQNSFTNAQGTWSVNGIGDLTYTPTLNYNGTATKRYTVQDNSGLTSNQGTIAIIVNPVNDQPIANDDSGTTNEDTAVTINNITGNDTDVDGTVNAATVDLDPVNGGIQNTLRSYTVNDNLGATSAAASISVTVNAVNDGPLAVDDNGTTNEDTPVTLINITSNDSDSEGTVDAATIDLDLLTTGIQNTISNAFGSWSVNGVGDVTYTPELNFNGLATKQYSVNDNNGATSAAATITITVISVNDQPIAGDDTGMTNEDTPITIANITINDSDVDGTIDASTVDLDPATGGIQNTFISAAGNWNVNGMADITFSPTLDFNGPATISYVVNDDMGATSASSNIIITVNPVNDLPVLIDLALSTPEDTPLTASVFDIGDLDPESTTLTVDTSPFSNPTNGSIVINVDGTFTYTPDLMFNGADAVEITICDSGFPLPAACAVKSINITVTPVNNPPEILVIGNLITATTEEDTPIVICFEAVDPDGDDVSLSSITLISGAGTLSLYNNIEFCFEFIPENDFYGIVTWQIELCDNGSPSLCASIQAVITVTPVNDAPVALPDTIRVLRKVLSNSNLLDNDFDLEGDQIDIITSPIQNPLYGTASISSAGELSYISDPTFRGIDSLVYQICDQGVPSQCAMGVVTIVVEDLPLRPYQTISPNGDGINDYWRIDGIDFYLNNQVRVFDRFNNTVFEIVGYDNDQQVWRGEANRGLGKAKLPDGTYFYTINLGDGSGLIQGFVVLKEK